MPSKDTKKKAQSWTLWINGLIAVVAAAAPYLTTALPKEASYTAIVMAIVNGVLRFKTNKPII